MTFTDAGPPEAQEGGEPPAGTRWQQTSHGKGRLRPRKNQPPNALPNLPRLTSVAYTGAEHGEREGDPRPRYPEHAADAWVEYIELDSQQNVYRALNKMWEHQPVLLRGSSLVKGLVGQWSWQHMAECINGKEQVRVLCSDARRHRFFEYEDAKNVYGGVYHVREPETQRLDMSFPDFVQCARQWRARRVHLRETVMRYRPPTQAGAQAGSAQGSDAHGSTAGSKSSSSTRQASNNSSGPAGDGGSVQRPSFRPQVAARSACGSGLAADLEGGIDWAWLESLQRSQRYGPVARVELSAGTAGGLLPAQYECQDRLIAQVTGRQRVLLLSPAQAFEGLYPYPLHHTYDRYSMVDFEAPDAGLWPKFSGMRGLTAILGPGDALYVPAYWFAHCQQLDAENAALTFHLHQGARPPSQQGTPLRLSRALEQRVAEVEGPGEVRHWLQVIGHAEEHEWIKLGTVKGYRRIVFCQSVRDDVDGALGVGAWADLLPRMCEGRLVPTPWLNKDFREPLYLMDKPVVLQDTRTDEERRYPELFRAKLTRDGWRVPPIVSTVPIPGVNMPKNADYRTWGQPQPQQA